MTNARSIAREPGRAEAGRMDQNVSPRSFAASRFRDGEVVIAAENQAAA